MPRGERWASPPFCEGDRVLVFDHLLFRDDVTTPLSHTIRPATVTRWYGERGVLGYEYPSLIDVRFDHRPEREPEGHFTDHIEREENHAKG